MTEPKSTKLTLGPLAYNWDPEIKRDFYFRMADESCFDVVYLGEVTCFKREIFFEPYFDAVVERLQKAGKEVVLSSLAMITRLQDIKALERHVASGLLVEANDVAAIQAVQGKPFVVGPFVNVFHEGTRDFMATQGANRIVLPVELSMTAMGLLAQDRGDVDLEVQVFGRQALAVAMRCYHARAYGRGKSGCQFVCKNDPDGLPVNTLDGQDILAINGTQVLSHGYVVLLKELQALVQAGLTYFRLMPQDKVAMGSVAKIYRDVLDQKLASDEAETALRGFVPDIPFINGFAKGIEGMLWE